MKTAIIFGSTNGRTRRVVREVVAQLGRPIEAFDAGEGLTPERVAPFDTWLFFAPTYGDEELQPDLERFVFGLSRRLEGTRFAVCELGNYYGYDDLSFGAARIIRDRLMGLGACEFVEPASIDSFPQMDWDTLRRWTALLENRLNAPHGS